MFFHEQQENEITRGIEEILYLLSSAQGIDTGRMRRSATGIDLQWIASGVATRIGHAGVAGRAHGRAFL